MADGHARDSGVPIASAGIRDDAGDGADVDTAACTGVVTGVCACDDAVMSATNTIVANPWRAFLVRSGTRFIHRRLSKKRSGVLARRAVRIRERPAAAPFRARIIAEPGIAIARRRPHAEQTISREPFGNQGQGRHDRR
jgi:hypothetical protein